MMRKRNEIEERRVEQLLARLWRHIPTPAEHELRAMAHSAAAEPKPAESVDGLGRRQARWRLRVGWTVAVAAIALLVGSGLGFGLSSSLTPSGSAGTTFVGFGFLPARGWTVVQSGAVSPTEGARAIAANVPLHPDDDLHDVPRGTLASLPPGGVLILATFTNRGDAGEDARFGVRELPLQIASAKPVSPSKDRDLAQYRLLAGVGGYNVDARIYFGAAPPSATMLAAAQRQLTRLVVTSERVTILARPTVVPGGKTVILFGSVDSRKEGEEVAIQAKDCGQDVFRVVDGAITREGGGWSTDWYPFITTTVRAVWNDVASAQITLRQRAAVYLRKERLPREFEVAIVGKKTLWRKRVLIQRFDPRLGTWSLVRTVVLTETGSNGPLTSTVYSRAEFSASFPKGTRLRAVFPLAQARPCYLAGVSLTLRV